MMYTLSAWTFLWLLLIGNLHAVIGMVEPPERCRSAPCLMIDDTSDAVSFLQTRAGTRLNTKAMMASDSFQGYRWTAINDTAACEINDQNIRVQNGRAVKTFAECKARCLNVDYCLAIDFYAENGWCNLYDQACDNPTMAKLGSSSYRLEIFMSKPVEKAPSPQFLGLNQFQSHIVSTSADNSSEAWTTINETATCEENHEGIEYFGHLPGFTLESCRASCEERENCTAIDFYPVTGWCLTYDKACTTPQLVKDGGISYRFARETLPVSREPLYAAPAPAPQPTGSLPTRQATAADVENYMTSIGAAWAGEQMKDDGIDGETFPLLQLNDLKEYGMKKGPALKLSRQIAGLRGAEEDDDDGQTVIRPNALHEVVGPDGVLMISLDRKPQRYQFSKAQLERAGISPTRFSATDLTAASKEELSRACPFEGEPKARESCTAAGKTGFGCKLISEQAIAASHLRALEEAQRREWEWTAIFEDDVVPNPIDGWSDLFEKAWRKVPSQVKVVRLGYCQLDMMHQPVPIYQYVHANVSGAVLTQLTGWGEQSPFYYEPGGCTTAYMVHRSILQEMINLFPCCGAVDSCYKWDFFKRLNNETGMERGMEILMNIDSPSPLVIEEGGNMQHHGLIVQDRVSQASSRVKQTF